jgi:putative cell wall-binding protein
VKLKRKCLPLKSAWQNNSLENVLRRTTKGATDFEKGLEAYETGDYETRIVKQLMRRDLQESSGSAPVERIWRATNHSWLL